MNIESQFRSSSSKQEILDSLSMMYIEESPVLIWQNVSGNRTVVKARISQIDLVNSSLVLRPYGKSQLSDFTEMNSSLTLYFIGESKNIVFKQMSKLKIDSSKQIRLDIPLSVKLQEKRAEIRLNYENTSQKISVDIFPAGRTDKSANSKVVNLRNISWSGMGVGLTLKDGRLFYEQDKIKIERIGPYTFPRPVYGIIMYMAADKSNSQVKMGIRFSEKLPEKVFEIFSMLNSTG